MFWKNTSKKYLLKQILKIKNIHLDHESRKKIMKDLLQIGTLESLTVLLERFKIVSNSPHWDEQEKLWITENIISKGETAKLALKNFILQEDNISYPILSLKNLCSPFELINFLEHVLENKNPESHHNTDCKLEIIKALKPYSEFNISLIYPFLNDFSDDIKCLAIEIIFNNKHLILPSIIKMVENNELSLRVLHLLAHHMIQLKIPMPPKIILADKIKINYVIKNNLLHLETNKIP